MAINFYFYDFEIVEPPRVTSLKNVEQIATFDMYGEDKYFVTDSQEYEYLLHKIVEEFLKSEKGSIIDNRLNLNKVVQEIQYTNESVKVLTEDGSIYTTNYIIVSTSIGVLQTKLIKFNPDLPHLQNEYPGANLIMVTVTDDESRRIEQQDDKETKAEAMAILRNMFGNHIPDAEEILVPKWGKDHFYCGTYSNWPIGVSTKDFNNLKAPIGPVYFTGEHTSQDHNGARIRAFRTLSSCCPLIDRSSCFPLIGFLSVPKSPLEMAIDFYFYDFEIAEPPRVTSLKNVEPIATFDTYGEDEYFVADSRGYEYLLHKIAEEFLKSEKGSIIDNRLNLNKVVREIQYTNESVKVLTEDGSIYTANYIIVSTSIGVLQTKLIKFKPDLPQWKILSIFKWDMVIYTKIFMKFPFKFWPTGLGTEFFIYAHEKRGYYNFWQHLENEYPGANLLMVTVTDDESRRIEQQDDNETKAEAMAVLRNMFGNHIPDAEEILVPKWGRDRFYCGTYSNWPIGVSTKDFNNLKAPIGPVYFTGEHTSQDDNGYVHGAYLAGIDTANMLLSCINEGDCAHPSHRQNVDKNASYLVDIQREREIGTQAWMEKVQVLEDALSTKCNP
eukprot:Gb_35099 [translate_table: standard]